MSFSNKVCVISSICRRIEVGASWRAMERISFGAMRASIRVRNVPRPLGCNAAKSASSEAPMRDCVVVSNTSGSDTRRVSISTAPRNSVMRKLRCRSSAAACTKFSFSRLFSSNERSCTSTASPAMSNSASCGKGRRVVFMLTAPSFSWNERTE